MRRGSGCGKTVTQILLPRPDLQRWPEISVGGGREGANRWRQLGTADPREILSRTLAALSYYVLGAYVERVMGLEPTTFSLGSWDGLGSAPAHRHFNPLQSAPVRVPTGLSPPD